MSSNGYVVVVGIDFSDLGNKALDQALEVTSPRAGEVHVVYVEHDRPFEGMLGSPFKEAVTNDQLIEQVRQRATERIAAVTMELGRLFVRRVVAHVRRGGVAEEIAQ